MLRDVNLLKEMGRATVSWSINTFDEGFRVDMDRTLSIRRRLDAMRRAHEAGLRTVCFVSPVFPGLTDIEAIFEEAHGYPARRL